MASILPKLVRQSPLKLLENRIVILSTQTCVYGSSERGIPKRRSEYFPSKPRFRHPSWFTKKNRVLHEDYVTKENEEFLDEIVTDRYINVKNPLYQKPIENPIQWTPNMKRTGVIAKKIGNIPMWLNNGKKIYTTMLQVLDNQVVRYYGPEEYNCPRERPKIIKHKKGCLLLGAESTSPIYFTKEYCGLFKDSGVMPKKYLARFFIGPEAVLPLGTSISALHFSVGNYVDIRGKTIDRGFQGVMKRHGFKGMPASHGVTKTHRRGGNIGGGGEKGRVWPGTKMPGHMGNRYRVAKGLKIYRINTKYNVLWVAGMGIPGETNSIVYIYDTNLPLRKPSAPLPFPTYFPTENQDIPEDIYDESVHKFTDPTIEYSEPSK